MKIYTLLLIIVLPFIKITSQTPTTLNRTDSLALKQIYDETSRFLDFNTDSARLCANKGINFSRTLKFQKGIADGYFYRAISFEIDNVLDSGILNYKKALQIYRAIDAAKSCAVTLSNLGEMYFKTGKIDEAYQSYHESLAYFKNTRSNEGIARSYFNIGIIFKVNGNYKVATDYFFRALTTSESIRDTIKISITYKEIGNIYLRQKNYDRAVYYYQEALKSLAKVNSGYVQNIKAGLKCNLGKTNEESGKYDDAYINYSEALGIYKEISNKNGMATILLNLGELFNKQKQYEKALAYNTESIEIAKTLNDPYIDAFSIYNRGSIYKGLNLYDKALALFHKALENTKKTNDMNLKKSIAEEISQTYEMMGDYKNAFTYFKIYKILKDSLNNDEITRRITTIELQYEFDKKQKAQVYAQQQKEVLYDAKIKKQRLYVKVIIVISSLILLFLFTGFGYYRNRQLAKFRALEIELSKTIQLALSQQMNPHFIFNCLNSIKALILDNKIEETEKYFGVFAGLMRKNLEYSQCQTIPINNEVEALQLYVQLEQLRFKQKFKFALQIDPEIDQFMCKIPPLILQPFVENSIIHGFKNIEHGTICVSIILNKDEIMCSIDDDGCGRILNDEDIAKRKHKSYGSQLTQKRLELIYKLYGTAKGLNIIDKKNQGGNPSGTYVEFGIPIIV